MIEKIYENIVKNISESDFATLIFIALSRKEKEELINKLDIKFLGVRISSLSEEELSEAIAVNFYQSISDGKIIIEYISKLASKDLEKVKSLSPEENIKYVHKTLNELEKNPDGLKQIKKFILAAIIDGRDKIIEIAKKTCELITMAFSFESIYKTFKNEKEKEFSNKKIKKLLKKLEDSNQKLIKENKELTLQNKKLEKMLSELKERIKKLEKEKGDLLNEKGEFKRKIEILENKIKELEAEREEKIQNAESSKLLKIIKEYEKEIKILKYEANKKSELCTKIDEERKKFETENYLLKEQIKNNEREKENLLKQIEYYKNEFERLKSNVEVPKKVEKPKLIHPKDRIGLFIDDESIRSNISQYFQGKKIDYEKLPQYIAGNKVVVRAVQYLWHTPSEKFQQYVSFLQKMGYTVKYISALPKTEQNKFILTDILNEVEAHNIGTVIIFSMNSEILKSLQYELKNKNIELQIYGIYDISGADDIFFKIEEYMLLK